MDCPKLAEGEYRFACIIWDHGSLPSFLTHFMGGRTLSDTEAGELKALIDQYREEKGHD